MAQRQRARGASASKGSGPGRSRWRRRLRRRTRRVRRRLRRAWRRNRPEVLHSYTLRPKPGRTRPPEGYQLVPATPALLQRFHDLYPDELSVRKRDLLMDRLTSPDHLGWVIRDPGGEPCGYCHVAVADTTNERINHRVRVRPHQAYFFDDYVSRSHRRRGLHTFSIAQRFDRLGDRGTTEGLTTITRTNTASIAAYRQFGLQRRRLLVHLRPLHRTISLPWR